MPVTWDYHVILVHAQGTAVYDFDSSLGFPVSLKEYIRQTIHPEVILNSHLKRYILSPPVRLGLEMETDGRRYRLIPGDEFLSRFSSDRRHMRNELGDWLSPPPPWDIIQNHGHDHQRGLGSLDNLQKYIEMEHCEEGFGEVLREDKFLEWCCYSTAEEDDPVTL